MWEGSHPYTNPAAVQQGMMFVSIATREAIQVAYYVSTMMKMVTPLLILSSTVEESLDSAHKWQIQSIL